MGTRHSLSAQVYMQAREITLVTLKMFKNVEDVKGGYRRLVDLASTVSSKLLLAFFVWE